MVEREKQETEKQQEEGNRRDKGEDKRIEERAQIKCDEDRTMVQEKRTEDITYDNMEDLKARRREELEKEE